MDLPDKTQGKSWEGAEVVDRDGERLGTCVGVFADIETDLTEWLQVDVAGHRPTFVPALDATEIGERVQVRFAKAQVLSAPQIGEDVELSQREEQQLYSHYGVAATTAESDSVLPVDLDATAPAATGAGTAAVPAMDADAAATPAPRLRRVPPPRTAAPAPVPAQTTAGAPAQSSDTSAAAPLVGIAGLVLGVWFVLRALERRAQRRRPAARAERLRRQVSSGSVKAAKQASRQWAATAETRRSVADAASSASDAAARQGRAASGTLAAASAAAAKAASKAGSDVSSSVDDASRKARKARKARQRKRQRRAVTGRLAAVSGVATQAASDAGSSASRLSTTGVSKKVRKRRSSGPVSGLTRSTRRAGSSAAGSVSAAPKKAKQSTRTVGKRVRKTKRSFVRTFWQLVTLGAAGGGYVLGAKAGRERYDELTEVAGHVAESPQVRSVTEAVTDPDKRSQALAAVQERLPGQGGPAQQG